MKKSLVISEQDSIAAILENDRVVEFFVNRGELLLGDIYSATVENILPGIDAAFVNLGKDKMGFLHANDVPGQGPLKERLVPKQKLLVQITKEPTGHKGPRVSTAISLPGRFLVLVPEERGVSISRRISEARERARLKSVVNLMKPPGVGLIIRTEAKGQGEQELFEDFEQLWDRWQTIVSQGEASIGPSLIYRDQDLLYRVIRDAYSHEVNDIICDSQDGQKRAQEYLQGWAGRQTRISHHAGEESILVAKGIDREIEAALCDRVELPSGGHLNIQPTEALTVIDVNSGRFTSSRTQAETVRRTNLEAAQEIPRQLRLRNIGGMVIVDFIDMDSRKDQQQVLEVFQRVLEEDRAKPQVGQLSDLGLVELTRRRQGQSLRELFTVHCQGCQGHGVVPTLEIGPADNRRVITFKLKEEEQQTKGRGSRKSQRHQGGGNLRAATAHNGRIRHAANAQAEAETEVEAEVEEFEGELEFVPEDILEQVPDDLLHGETRELKSAQKRSFDELGEDEEEAEESEIEEVGFEVHGESFSPTTAIFEEGFIEDEAEEDVSDLTESITEVERVYKEMSREEAKSDVAIIDLRSQEREQTGQTSFESPTRLEVTIEPGEEMEAAGAQAESAEEAEEEDEQIAYTPSSPYETEVDPVTGVYRLKMKAPSGDDESDEGGEATSQSLESDSVQTPSNETQQSQEGGFSQLQLNLAGEPAHEGHAGHEHTEPPHEATDHGAGSESEAHLHGEQHHEAVQTEHAVEHHAQDQEEQQYQSGETDNGSSGHAHTEERGDSQSSWSQTHEHMHSGQSEEEQSSEQHHGEYNAFSGSTEGNQD